MTHDDLTLNRTLGCRNYFNERVSGSSNDGLSSPFPVIGKQLSATFVELEPVGRTNIVSTVKQFFEDITASFTPGPRASGRRPSDRARSRSALGIVTATSGHDMKNETGINDDHHQKHRQSLSMRQLDFSSCHKLSETARRRTTTSTSGVGSLPVPISKTPDVIVAHHSDTSRKIDGRLDVDLQAETIENNGMTSAHGASHAKQDDQQTAVKRGWLLKMSQEQLWERRWCVFDNPTLFCFRHQQAPVAEDEQAETIIIGRPSSSTCLRAVVNLVDIRGQFAFVVIATDQSEHVFSAMTSGIRSNWMRAILSCVSKPTSPNIDDTDNVLSSTPINCVQLKRHQHRPIHPDPLVSSSYRPTHRVPVSPVLSSTTRRLDTTAATKLGVTGNCVPIQHHQVAAVVSKSSTTATTSSSSCSSSDCGGGVVQGRAAGRRRRRHQDGVQGNTRTMISPLWRDDSYKAAVSGGRTETRSSETCSSSDSDDSTTWTHHLISDNERSSFQSNRVEPDINGSTETIKVSSNGADPQRDTDGNFKRKVTSSETGMNSSTIKRPSHSALAGTPEILSQNDSARRDRHHQTPKEVEHLNHPVQSTSRQTSLISGENDSHLTLPVVGIDEKDKMIDALAKLLAMKTERLEQSERAAVESHTELSRLRRQLVQSSSCIRCQPLIDTTSIESSCSESGTLREADLCGDRPGLMQHESQETVQVEHRTPERGVGDRPGLMQPSEQNESQDIVQVEHRIPERAVGEGLRLAHEAERWSVSLTQVIKKNEQALVELEVRLANSEKCRKDVNAQLAAEMEENRRTKNETDQLRLELDRTRSEMNIERERAAGLTEDIRHLRLKFIDETAMKKVQARNALLSEQLERVEAKLEWMCEAETELKSILEGSERTIDLVREQLTSTKVELEGQSIRATTAEMRAIELQLINEELTHRTQELENSIASLRKNLEDQSKEMDDEKDRTRHAKLLASSVNIANSKLVSKNQTLKNRCIELEELEKKIAQTEIGNRKYEPAFDVHSGEPEHERKDYRSSCDFTEAKRVHKKPEAPLVEFDVTDSVDEKRQVFHGEMESDEHRCFGEVNSVLMKQNVDNMLVGEVEMAHRRLIEELQRIHSVELEELRREKDELLKDEAKATQAALDVMQKAHEVALQKEKRKLVDLITKSYCDSDIEYLRRQHTYVTVTSSDLQILVENLH